jgi:hypothetical protein
MGACNGEDRAMSALIAFPIIASGIAALSIAVWMRVEPCTKKRSRLSSRFLPATSLGSQTIVNFVMAWVCLADVDCEAIAADLV